jgi:hypothetical protein
VTKRVETDEEYEDRWNTIHVLRSQVTAFVEQWDRVAAALEEQEPGIIPGIKKGNPSAASGVVGA